MSIVLFTRLDGVFHPEGTYVDSQGVARCIAMGASPFQFASAVQDVIAKRDLQIVICSSWLQKMLLQQLRELAQHWMRRHIVGACEQIDELDDIQRPRRVRSMWSLTSSGRACQLKGRTEVDRDGEYVPRRWARINHATQVKDVGAEVWKRRVAEKGCRP